MKMLLNNPLMHSFLDDMTYTVGVKQWALYTLAAVLITYGLWGTSFIPFVEILGLIMVANLLMATVVSAWWKLIGREKYAQTTLMDIAEATKGRDT